MLAEIGFEPMIFIVNQRRRTNFVIPFILNELNDFWYKQIYIELVQIKSLSTVRDQLRQIYILVIFSIFLNLHLYFFSFFFSAWWQSWTVAFSKREIQERCEIFKFTISVCKIRCNRNFVIYISYLHKVLVVIMQIELKIMTEIANNIVC